MADNLYHYGVGRRKEAIATTRIYTGGKGDITINQLPIEQYFNHGELQSRAMSPLKLAEKIGQHVITIQVKGGGLSGQADAIRLSIAKALVDMDNDLRSTLKRAGYMKRDARVKERKKYGLKRARKASQFTKR